MSNGNASDIHALKARLAEAGLDLSSSQNRRPLSETKPLEEKPDGMLGALIAAARHHFLPVEAADLIAGIASPLDDCTDNQLHSIGMRVGLLIDRRKTKISQLKPQHCPAIVRFKDGSTGLIANISARGKVTVEFPDQDVEPKNLTRFQLNRRSARVYIVRPFAESETRKMDDTRSVFSWRVLKENAGLFVQAILATIAINVLGLAIPLFTMNVYDRVLPSNAVNTLVALGIGALIAIGFDFLLKTLRGLIVDAATRRSDVRLSNLLMHRIVGAKTNAQGSPVGVQMNTMRELETLRDFYTSATLTAFGDLPFVILFLAVIWMVAGPLVLVPMVAIVLVLISALATQRPLRYLMTEIFARMSNKSAVLAEALSGLETLKSTGAQNWALARWERAVADQLSLSSKVKFFSSLAVNLVALWQGLAVIATIVLGVGLVHDGTISSGAVIAAVLLLSRAMAPISQLAALAGRMHQVSVARAALMGVLEAPQERRNGTQLISRAQLKGEVKFDGVSFSYCENTLPALSDVSFLVEPGERVAIIGSIGSGKSTVLKLLMKSHTPDNGLIRIDQVGLTGLDPVSLRGNIGYLSQDAALFRTTIRENIVLHNTSLRDDDIIRAAQEAGSLPWISKLPSGFDTILGERGEGLSGGQKRSLALTRALAGQPDLLLLDEPTSEVDGQTEMAIIKQLKATLGQRTLILVTHKPATLALVNRLIVMEGGKVMLDGPKADVLDELAAQSKIGAKRGAGEASAA